MIQPCKFNKQEGSEHQSKLMILMKKGLILSSKIAYFLTEIPPNHLATRRSEEKYSM